MNGKLTVIRMPDDSLLYFSTELTEPDQQYVAKAFWDQRWWRYVSFIKLWGPNCGPVWGCSECSLLGTNHA